MLLHTIFDDLLVRYSKVITPWPLLFVWRQVHPWFIAVVGATDGVFSYRSDSRHGYYSFNSIVISFIKIHLNPIIFNKIIYLNYLVHSLKMQQTSFGEETCKYHFATLTPLFTWPHFQFHSSVYFINTNLTVYSIAEPLHLHNKLLLTR